MMPNAFKIMLQVNLPCNNHLLRHTYCKSFTFSKFFSNCEIFADIPGILYLKPPSVA